MASKLNIATFVDDQFGENGYVLSIVDAPDCWIIDPGFAPSPDRMIAHIKSKQLTPTALILTHGHLDHIAGVPDIREAFPDVPVYIAQDARPALTDPNENGSAGYGIPLVVGDFETIDMPHGSELKLGDSEWLALDTSGHAPGSRSLYCEEVGVVFVGDALFQQSIGRTDFANSDHDELIRNIKEKLLTLPDETRVFSGHLAATTIGDEKRYNPYLR
ncbi:MAG: MBL fold metallo-hydrolase [Phycisphaerales bacterium]|nr:MBL fold metallo-hydrolase [Phycisphaerales bacterium]MCB9856907.1 MBL fold metallo-hydrolase [Phycisphaerales bacterium]MCB9861966.1 MBL fold metallo-hydrolase [Phycisphaerales bacterium]